MKIDKDKPCSKCGRFDNRGVSVDAVIFKDDKVLLIKRGEEPFQGYWATPGGFLGWDETLEEAVAREVKEETNLDVVGVRFVSLNSSPERHPNQVINVVFKVEVTGVPKKGDDATEIKWFNLKNLPNNLAFDHRQNIKESIEYNG